MATRTRKAAAAADAPALAFEIAEEGMPRTERTRAEKPIHTMAAVQHAQTTGKPVRIPVPNDLFIDAKEVENDARRAANKLGVGLSFRDAGSFVYLGVKAHRNVNYTTAEIRAWAQAVPEIVEWAEKNGVSLTEGRLAKEVRDAYKTAHGYGVKE